MNSDLIMPCEYLALAAVRATAECTPYKQPEAFGYEFASWVSPYTKGAHRMGGLAFVLQDWASEEGLREFNPDIQLHGRTPELLTNLRFEKLLNRVFGLALAEVYVTNAFPFVKTGSMSAAIPARDVRDAARRFLLPELQLVKPTRVFALGAVASMALNECGTACIRLPHPAARIGSLERHESVWRAALRVHAAEAENVA